MREIKFRAWDKERKKMVGGCCNLMFDCSGIIYWQFGYSEPQMLGRGDESGFMLMQFTGLTDRNGVEIWEGDILNTWVGISSKPHKTKVIFEDAAFRGEPCDVGYVKFSIGNEFQQHEVIGNIYENPELLEAADA